jgi:hypothetical protein
VRYLKARGMTILHDEVVLSAGIERGHTLC